MPRRVAPNQGRGGQDENEEQRLGDDRPYHRFERGDGPDVVTNIRHHDGQGQDNANARSHKREHGGQWVKDGQGIPEDDTAEGYEVVVARQCCKLSFDHDCGTEPIVATIRAWRWRFSCWSCSGSGQP